MNKTVSVIMPVRKLDAHCYEALDSILAQTYRDLEIIIIVDYSDVDASRKILGDYLSFNHKYDVKVIGSRITGIAAALNAGIQESSGLYIARMDSDDVSAPTRIAQQVQYLESNERCQILATRARYLSESGIEIGASPELKKLKNIYGAMCRRNLIIHPTVVMRSNYIKKLGGYSSQSSEDYDLWLRALATDKDSISILNQELLGYRIHQNQLSQVTRVKGQAAVCAVLFGAMIRKFEFVLLIGLTINIFKLFYRKLTRLW
jgi:glycosyltransferase involved in cell wall biosynthesis